MNDQNINPELKKSNQIDQNTENDSTIKTGLDKWNERLDENLEPEDQADVQADENAEDFQDEADENAKSV
ncbi:MAG: hypothetical protein EOO85_13870 [Pedobacter sp.]|nr:MAG: hypothetical protein EOO85_13870 [Pedobacter sp.]